MSKNQQYYGIFVSVILTSLVLGLVTLNELLFVRYKNRILFFPLSQYDILMRETPPDVMMTGKFKIVKKLSVLLQTP